MVEPVAAVAAVAEGEAEQGVALVQTVPTALLGGVGGWVPRLDVSESVFDRVVICKITLINWSGLQAVGPKGSDPVLPTTIVRSVAAWTR